MASWTVIALAASVAGLVAARPALGDVDLGRAVFLAITRGGGAGLVAALACAAMFASLTRRAHAD